MKTKRAVKSAAPKTAGARGEAGKRGATSRKGERGAARAATERATASRNKLASRVASERTSSSRDERGSLPRESYERNMSPEAVAERVAARRASGKSMFGARKSTPGTREGAKLPSKSGGPAARKSVFGPRDHEIDRKAPKAVAPRAQSFARTSLRAPEEGEFLRPRRPRREIPRETTRLVPGTWLFATRAGSEQDLVDELELLRVKTIPVIVAPGLVMSADVPKRDKAPVELTFARQGFPIASVSRSYDLAEHADKLVSALVGRLSEKDEYAQHVWVADSDEGNMLSSFAGEFDELLAARIQERVPNVTRVDDAALRRSTALLFVQACVIDNERAVAGVSYANQAISLARGGRTRVRVKGELPSRAARKIEEAFAWLGVAPGPGETCVDLGAAPGGWTYVLSERRARVIAVDPAQLREDIAQKRNVKHIQANAFTYAPDEPVDWLFCDMAYRPLEVAALLAKWGRKGWARMLVANIKLPMKRKAEILARVKQILQEEGGFKHVRAKQLYHDRDEITLCAHAK
jgi:23S rRNA (cytidine2498-2'-O)-methyltransferase